MTSTTGLLLRTQSETLAEAIVARQYELQPQVWKPYGSIGRAKSVRDVRYHLNYLTEALDAGDAGLFTDYLAWVRVLFAGLGFPEPILLTTLDCTRQVLSEQLPSQAWGPVLEILEEGRKSLEQAPVTITSYLTGSTPLDQLARQYLDALLVGDRFTASRMILKAVEQGTPVKEVYLHVFQSSQKEIGRLWQNNQISVAQEHYCTAATQLVMSQLYPYLFASAKKGPRLVAACVSGELHEIGARMVADFFEMDGWDTYFLGANTPTESILRTIDERHPDFLAISATMTFHLERVRELITAVRQSGLKVRVMVGGYPFNIAPNLWQSIGADAYAGDAQSAVIAAERLVA